MSPAGRLGTLDAFRGLAVVLMIAVHAFHSWLTPAAKQGLLWYEVRTLGGYPATMFLFVAGLLLAVGSEGRHARGRTPREVLAGGLERGAEVFGWALVFRLAMFVGSGLRDIPNLGRVDVLNCMGVALVACAVPLGLRTPRARFLGCGALAVGLATLAPVTWGAQWPLDLPPPLGGYVSGRVVRSFFPLLPWGAFAAAGATAGVWLAPRMARGRGSDALLRLGPAGLAVMGASWALDRFAPSVYAYQDYWKTGPTFTAWKLGVVLVLLAVFSVWDRLPGPSALRQLGRTSLLVYWAHIEIVYGAVVLPGWRGRTSEGRAVVGYVVLVAAMLGLSLLRTHLASGRAPAPPAATAA